MRIFSFVSVLAALPAFFLMLYEKIYSAEDAGEAQKSVRNPLIKAWDSFERFMNSFYVVVGSSVLGLIIDPPDAEKKADVIFDEFRNNYSEFLKDFKALLDEINRHREGLRQSLDGEWTNIDYLRGAFEEKRPDWDSIAARGTFVYENPVTSNERRYSNRMLSGMKSFLEDEVKISDAGVFDMIYHFGRARIPAELSDILFGDEYGE
ncbi:hypothetical protein [Methanoplanus limicola]|uniref:Uncharacterized protein n=1 Tax=Methanoplanus limicola DSM 2279 TaxID=937775 RepID=H1YYJ0_9EURY|nr:hypothetical protein [Methanoplanus limicola]EHQ35088.1 hypothetical protein Metlim_0966 [Methanoplanus limicola DSM 2279]